MSEELIINKNKVPLHILLRISNDILIVKFIRVLF